MAWTDEQIEELRAECFANDIKYDLAAMQDWDEEKIREFFENGGAEEAPPAPEVELTKDIWTYMPPEVKYKTNGSVVMITLNRPDAKNAIDAGMTEGLMIAIERIKATPSIRIVFLTGAGPMFCAGGDPKGFQAAAKMAEDAKTSGGEDMNKSSSMDFAHMLRDLANLDAYVVGLANGTAMGGGFGLLSCCDCVVAKKTAMFALSEVKLGVIPATISPYVVEKIGVANSRRLFMTGEAITSEQATKINLVQVLVDDEKGLETEAKRICKVMTLAAPEAVKASKRLVQSVKNKVIDETVMAYTAGQLAMVRAGEEAVSGMAAVQAGTKPVWASKELTLPTD